MTRNVIVAYEREFDIANVFVTRDECVVQMVCATLKKRGENNSFER